MTTKLFDKFKENMDKAVESFIISMTEDMNNYPENYEDFDLEDMLIWFSEGDYIFDGFNI